MSNPELTSRLKLPALKRKFVYDHDVDILENNQHALEMQSRIGKQIKQRSSRKQKTRSHTRNHESSTPNYNKWYIAPDMRYIQVPKNPKQNTVASENPQYIYDNLRNKQFWNWIHPLETRTILSQRQSKGKKVSDQNGYKNRLNLKILQDFRKAMEQSKKRVPLIVQQLLVSKN